MLIIQRRLTHYRVSCFETLRAELHLRDVDLAVAYGKPTALEKTKRDCGELGWAKEVPTYYLSIGLAHLCWQPIWRMAREADLAVVTQENCLLLNYLLQLQRPLARGKLAFWGHGRNFQAPTHNGVRELWKRFWLRRVDWWFAYTELTVNHLNSSGYPLGRITCLNNSIDTHRFRGELAAVASELPLQLRSVRGIAFDAPLGIFCGSLYAEKRLDLLIAAADQIKLALPPFHLIVIGDGPQGDWLRAQSRVRPWLHYVGALHGAEKAVWYRTAKVVLNPGLVGLGILDAFAAGLPIVTTAGARHSPEIAYLRQGVNGIMTGNSETEFADATISLLRDECSRSRMALNALHDADRYTVENMARRFADGIQAALCID